MEFYKKHKYPDGSSYINETQPATTTFKINTYEDLFHLNQFVDAYNDKYNEKPTIVIPCLLDQQADRRFNKGESFGLKLVLKELIQMNANFKIFHPHNQEVVSMAFEICNKKVEIIDNSKFINHVIYNEIYPSYDPVIKKSYYKNNKELENNLILMSSDAGGFKPLMKLCDKLNWKGETTSASKARSYESGKTTLHQIVPIKDFNGKDILIIDDICVYGGTFKGLAKLLRERNCGKLYLAISHMTVQNLGEDPVTNYFDTIYTTNSKFDWYSHNYDERTVGGQPNNLKIIKLF